jgi:putative restriction endonuclease
LLAYNYQCAVCGLDVRLGSITIGLEAAHIKWHQANGPDNVNNGLALCSLHHKIFDLGAFTIDADLRLLVSDKVHGTARLDDVLLRHHGQVISSTTDPDHRPLTTHLDWHRKQVFKEGVRFPKAFPPS